MAVTIGPEERERYARQIILREIGGSGQRRLKGATVAVIGAGGIGAPAIAYLAGAGLGEIRIVDDDRIDISNLQRQILFDVADTGAFKAEQAAKAAECRNPFVTAAAIVRRINAGNAEELLRGADVILGPVTGVLGSMAALETIRAITPFGADPAGRLTLIDLLDCRFRTIRVPKDPACPACSPRSGE